MSKILQLGGVLRDVPIFWNILLSVAKKSNRLKGTNTKITSQKGGFLNFLLPLMTAGLPLMKNILTPLGKSVLTTLGVSWGISAADATIQKKYGSGTTALIILNEEMKDIMKTAKLLEESGLLIKGVSGTIKNEVRGKRTKNGFLSMLLGTLAAGILGNELAGKGVIKASENF